MDKSRFRRVCGRFATGVTVATAFGADGTPHGMTANSFSSVSLEPPLVLICVGHTATILPHIRTAESFGINILTEGQQHISELFARKGYDRFDGVAWHRGETGVPLLRGVLATMECARRQIVASGDHDIIVGEVVRAHWNDDERPLVYFAGQYLRLES